MLSDCTKHDAVTVHVFLKKLVSEVKKIHAGLERVRYFSDGCAGQYKNRYNFVNLTHHYQYFGLQAEWNFFGTSHGKTACDGIGGTVKRAVARESMTRTVTGHILRARDMFEFCDEKLTTNIKFSLIEESEIAAMTKELAPRFAAARTIPGTQKHHQFVPTEIGRLTMHELSRDDGRVVRVVRSQGRSQGVH